MHKLHPAKGISYGGVLSVREHLFSYCRAGLVLEIWIRLGPYKSHMNATEECKVILDSELHLSDLYTEEG